MVYINLMDKLVRPRCVREWAHLGVMYINYLLSILGWRGWKISISVGVGVTATRRRSRRFSRQLIVPMGRRRFLGAVRRRKRRRDLRCLELRRRLGGSL